MREVELKDYKKALQLIEEAESFLFSPETQIANHFNYKVMDQFLTSSRAVRHELYALIGEEIAGLWKN